MAEAPTAPLRLAIHGAAGRVGRLLLELALVDPRFTVVAALVRPGSPLESAPVQPGSALVFSSAWPAQFDVVIDFSLPAALPTVIAAVQLRGAALVSGSTGLSADAQSQLDALAREVPLLTASNFSLGATVLATLVRLARQLLPAEFDCAIIEAHHRAKLDAPSGTALTLAAAVATAGPSPPISSVRAGRIVGEHSVLLAGPAERLELIHRADDRSVFARGALTAAAWLHGRAPARYQIENLLDPLAR